MAIRRKEIKPVDRALAELNAQIATLEKQMRDAGAPAPAPAPGESLKAFLKQMLTPPSAKPATPAYRPVPDVEVNPMHALEVDSIPFVRVNEPDLFSHIRQPAGAGGDTFGKLYAAGSTRPPKPTLKRVQRETRNRFYMWLGLSFVALWLIYAVVR